MSFIDEVVKAAQAASAAANGGSGGIAGQVAGVAGSASSNGGGGMSAAGAIGAAVAGTAGTSSRGGTGAAEAAAKMGAEMAGKAGNANSVASGGIGSAVGAAMNGVAGHSSRGGVSSQVGSSMDNYNNKGIADAVGKQINPSAGKEAVNDRLGDVFGKGGLGSGPVGSKIGNPIGGASTGAGGIKGSEVISPNSKYGSALGSGLSGAKSNPSGSGYSPIPATGPIGGPKGGPIGGPVGGSTGGSGGAGSIILEPKQMFQTLQNMEQATQEIIKMIREISTILEAASIVTFAVGFGELVKVAEQAINQVGSAVVAANNAFNRACTEVVNQLVDKFASEGAKSDYSEPPFQEVSIRVNLADRAQVYPAVVRVIFDDQQQHNRRLGQKTNDMREMYRQTQSFWVGSAADKTRLAFEQRVVPKFEELFYALNDIVSAGLAWVDEALRFEASLGV